MLETIIVLGIAIVIFVLFFVIVLQVKKKKKVKSKIDTYSCTECTDDFCNCYKEDQER